MEISRREHGRWFHDGPPRLDYRRNSRFSNSEPPVNYNSWNKRFSPLDSDFQQADVSHSYRSHRGPHPYQRNQHPIQRTPAPAPPAPAPLSSDPNKIPSLLTMELAPLPLFPPEEVESLRANAIRGMQYEEYEEYEDTYDESPPLDVEEPLTEEEYLREEQKTKQQIEEIIAVAQALREKLDREEELRRQAEQPIPKLMDLKPKIPSLLDIYVPPPIISEELCWNCNCSGHRFTQCNVSQQEKFCYRCGERGFDVGSCPNCYTTR